LVEDTFARHLSVHDSLTVRALFSHRRVSRYTMKTVEVDEWFHEYPSVRAVRDEIADDS